MRCVALDVGERRIGLATGESALGLATPLTVFTRRSLERDVATIRACVEQVGAGAVVVGLAQRAEESLQPRAVRVARLVQHLRAALPVPVVCWNEELTTYEALQRRRAQGRRGRRARQGLDAEAAAILLEGYFTAGSPGLASDE